MKYLEIAGLTIELIGVFLLSVEAIKPNNLARLANFSHIKIRALLDTLNGILPFFGYILGIIGWGFLIFIVLRSLNISYATDNIGIALIVGFFGIIALLLLLIVTMLMINRIRLSFENALTSIQENTPAGTTGIVGFFVVVFGWMLKVVAIAHHRIFET